MPSGFSESWRHGTTTTFSGQRSRSTRFVHARIAGDERREAAAIRYIVSDALWGPEHVDLAIPRCRAILDETQNRRSQANCLVRIGGLEGLAGRFDAAREAIAQARAIMDEFGLRHLKAHSSDVAVIVEMLAGEYESAELEARAAHAVLEEMGDLTYEASQALLIASALEAQGRIDEAEEWLVSCAELGDPDRADLALHAQIMVRRGDLEAAEMLARQALAEGPELTGAGIFGDPLFTLAEVLTRRGRLDEAREAVEQSLRCYEAKGIAPLIEQAMRLRTQISA